MIALSHLQLEDLCEYGKSMNAILVALERRGSCAAEKYRASDHSLKQARGTDDELGQSLPIDDDLVKDSVRLSPLSYTPHHSAYQESLPLDSSSRNTGYRTYDDDNETMQMIVKTMHTGLHQRNAQIWRHRYTASGATIPSIPLFECFAKFAPEKPCCCRGCSIRYGCQ